MTQQTFSDLTGLFDVRKIINDNANDAEARLNAISPGNTANTIQVNDGSGGFAGFVGYQYTEAGGSSIQTIGNTALGSQSAVIMNSFSALNFRSNDGNNTLIGRIYNSGNTAIKFEGSPSHPLFVNNVQVLATGLGDKYLADNGVYKSIAGFSDKFVGITALDTDPGFLSDKLVTSPTLQYQQVDPGANEKLKIINYSAAGARVWSYDASVTTPGDPGSTAYRLNHATQNLATEMYINPVCVPNGNLTAVLAALSTGDTIFAESVGEYQFKQFVLSGPPVDNGGWLTIPITVAILGPDITDGSQVSFGFYASGPVAGAPVFDVFGRVGNVVAAASDYDASQVDNDSGVIGAFVSDALDTLETAAGNAQTAADNAVQSIVAGTNITVNNADPQNPIVSSTGGGGTSAFGVEVFNIASATGNQFMTSNTLGRLYAMAVIPVADVQLAGMSFLVAQNNGGGTFGVGVYDESGILLGYASGKTASLGTNEVALEFDGARAPLTAPISLTAGTPYYFCLESNINAMAPMSIQGTSVYNPPGGASKPLAFFVTNSRSSHSTGFPTNISGSFGQVSGDARKYYMLGK